MDIISLSKAAALIKEIDIYEAGTIGSGPNDIYSTAHDRILNFEQSVSGQKVNNTIKIDFAEGVSSNASASSNKQSLTIALNGSSYFQNGSFISAMIDLGESFLSITSLSVSHSISGTQAVNFSYQQANQANDAVFSTNTWTLFSGTNYPTKRYLKFKWELTANISSSASSTYQFDNATAGNQFQSNEYVTYTTDVTLKKSYVGSMSAQVLGSGKQFSISVDPSLFYGFIVTSS